MNSWLMRLQDSMYHSDRRPIGRLSDEMSVEVSQIGSLSMLHLDLEGLTCDRNQALIRNDPREDLIASLMISGSARYWYKGKANRQEAGDMLLWRSSKPIHWEFPGRVNSICLRIPVDLASARTFRLDSICGIPTRGATDVSAFAIASVLSARRLRLARQAAAGWRICGALVDIVLSGVQSELCANALSEQSSWRVVEEAKEYILARLSDADLAIDDVAAALNMSRRTLSRHCTAVGVPLSRWMWERRLIAAQRMLTDTCTESVGSIAMNCGFSSFSHFSRSFRARFNARPRDVWLESRKPSATADGAAHLQ